MIVFTAACGTAVAIDRVDETGELGEAPYRIQIPENWNNGLVMYAHGYLTEGRQWRPLADALSAVFLSRGFAFAESGYSRQGWAVAEAIEETEQLREHFTKNYGRPDTTFVTGHSMGGIITLATIETYPENYDGALPFCGPLAPSLVFIKDTVFDMLVTFEALFGQYLPDDARPVIEAPELSGQIVAAAFAADSSMTRLFARQWDIRLSDLVATISFYHLFYREIAARAGGNPIDNCNSLYTGLGDERSLNNDVPRYRLESGAFDYLHRFYTPTGNISDPVLAVHTTYDAGVPPALQDNYDTTVRIAGNGDKFVMMRVEADGHCRFTPGQTGDAFDMLRKWLSSGVKPDAGVLR